MKTFATFSFALLFVFTISSAQTTAMQINGLDCNGNAHDLFSELDAGKAVILHFFMPSCGSCPPPAQKIQAMANNIMNTYPGMITAYAMPYQNSTTCSYTSTWCSTNNLSLYMPYDSGATQVAYYGGFGMPTVVLLGGTDHRVMYSSLNFVTSDTTEMRDSILALFGPLTSGQRLKNEESAFNIYPNPSNENVSMQIDIKRGGNVKIEILNLSGEIVEFDESRIASGLYLKEFNTSFLPSGIYLARVSTNGNFLTKKFSIIH